MTLLNIVELWHYVVLIQGMARLVVTCDCGALEMTCVVTQL